MHVHVQAGLRCPRPAVRDADIRAGPVRQQRCNEKFWDNAQRLSATSCGSGLVVTHKGHWGFKRLLDCWKLHSNPWFARCPASLSHIDRMARTRSMILALALALALPSAFAFKVCFRNVSAFCSVRKPPGQLGAPSLLFHLPFDRMPLSLQCYESDMVTALAGSSVSGPARSCGGTETSRGMFPVKSTKVLCRPSMRCSFGAGQDRNLRSHSGGRLQVSELLRGGVLDQYPIPARWAAAAARHSWDEF